MAARYGLDGLVTESRWGQDFPHPSRLTMGLTQLAIRWVPTLSPGVKRPGRGVNLPPKFIAEVKERVELYLDLPSGASWPVLG